MKIYCVKCKQKTDSDNIENITIKNNRMAIRGNCKICNTQKYMFVKNEESGKGIDIHKMINKIPRPRSGWTPGNYKYLGPYNPLESQVILMKIQGTFRRLMYSRKINWMKSR